ncbi:unnamed protein product [Xylocopa violacea]|uniref:Uncharacterized protein n=1 Tax=Xylocopa violacea TaxID=135666 RepID=A0ABP1NDP5_XYLVO
MGNKPAKSKCEMPKTGKSVSTTDNTVILFSHPPPHLPPRPPSRPPRPPSRPPSCPPNPPKRPTQFMTVEEFFKNWHIWKNQFLLYKTEATQVHNEQQWGNTLLNLMGPIGQNIYSTFTFESSNEIRNVDVLLEKFDEYSVFSNKKKLPLENVYEYINDLQVIVRDKNIHVNENADEMIRKKICKEIDKYQFTNAAKRMIPTFIFSSDFNKLTMKEIAFIWELYIDNTCKRCGNNHGTQKCSALENVQLLMKFAQNVKNKTTSLGNVNRIKY